MAQRAAIAFSMPFAVRGLALAEQRLAYLTELYDSGRWRRFHDEADFLFNIREAKAAVENWRRLVEPASEIEPVGSVRARDPTFHAQGGATGNRPVGSADGLAGPDCAGGAGSGAAASPVEPLEPYRWRQKSSGLLPIVGFSANGVVAEADLRKAG